MDTFKVGNIVSYVRGDRSKKYIVQGINQNGFLFVDYRWQHPSIFVLINGDPFFGETSLTCCNTRKIERIQQRLFENMESKKVEILTYCQPHTELMWSAKIISILLECDFRDAKEKVNEYLQKEINK